MSDVIIIELTIEEPVELLLTSEPPVYIEPSPTPPEEPLFTSSEAYLFRDGDKAKLDGAAQISTGIRYSNTHAGIEGHLSWDDDYLYVCVKTGTAGNAIWKKAMLFQT